MPIHRKPAAALDRDFLETRSRLLDLAAALDRLDRDPSSFDPSSDPRVRQVREGLSILLSNEPGRAERVQRLFSLEYQADWRERFGLPAGKKTR
jgi:hypothetical protein